MRAMVPFHQRLLPPRQGCCQRLQPSRQGRIWSAASTVNSATASQTAAFTRLELAAILSAVALLALVALPVLANTKPRADRVTCMNNLRQVGRAELVWANDHNEILP